MGKVTAAELLHLCKISSKYFITPKITRKPKVFWWFQGVNIHTKAKPCRFQLGFSGIEKSRLETKMNTFFSLNEENQKMFY